MLPPLSARHSHDSGTPPGGACPPPPPPSRSHWPSAQPWQKPGGAIDDYAAAHLYQERHRAVAEAFLRAMLNRNMSDNELVRQLDHMVENVVALPL
ncbi:hypothetical protein GQ55_5G395100 [Panicum hallii var. hallii]|uniref:Uncharacterized protein n=1 Tax=Panicum hallii var. hallii TaxID=1504633 RepID=A0A2T7DN64_9POAL|nr:hypothetical protein GQ55_5G395100 [Panicum hallii var. hallii]